MAVSTTTTTPTGWAADAAYQNWLKASQAIDRPYTAYPGNMLAGYSPNTQAGLSQLANGQGYGGAAMQAGSNAAQNAANYQAPMVNPGGYAAVNGTTMNTDSALAGPAALASASEMNRGTVRDVTSRNFTDYDINAYMNPYTNTVVNNAMADLSRQNDITNNTTNARAAAAGAFGGSRQAVANSLNNEAFLRESGNLSGNLRNQAFNTASGLIQTDAARNLQAQQLNQGMDWNVGNLNTNIANSINQLNAGALNARAQYNASNQQEANRLTAAAHNEGTARNQAAQNAALQFGADQSLKSQGLNQAAGQSAANLWLTSANALNGMGLDQQLWNSRNAQAQLSAGALQQQMEQARINDAYARWQQEYNYPLTQADQRRAALGGYNSGSMSSEPYYPNTAANVVSGAMGAAQLGAAIPGAVQGVTAGWDALSNWLNPAQVLAPTVATHVADTADTAFDIMDSFW